MADATSGDAPTGTATIDWEPRVGSPGHHDFRGASVLIAGATGGLGSALAVALGRQGADLTLVSRSEEGLAELPVEGTRIALDLRTPEACAAAVDEAVGRHGRLDVVVNATGVVAFGPVESLSVDALEELLLTNTMLPVLLAQAAWGRISRGGVIVNISGVIAEKNVAGMAAYGASKAALRAFDEGFAREARRVGVRVLDARPPHTDTELSRHPIEGEAPPLGDGLDPASVAEVICDAIATGARDLPSDAFGRPDGGRS